MQVDRKYMCWKLTFGFPSKTAKSMYLRHKFFCSSKNIMFFFLLFAELQALMRFYWSFLHVSISCECGVMSIVRLDHFRMWLMVLAARLVKRPHQRHLLRFLFPFSKCHQNTLCNSTKTIRVKVELFDETNLNYKPQQLMLLV